jgi:hypothetical protein
MSPENEKSPAPGDKGKEFGEGNYAASRDYNERTRKFVDEKGKSIEQLAEEAEDALEGEEGAELRKAEEEGKSHAKR